MSRARGAAASSAPWRLRADELAARGDGVALASRDEALTYAELARRAERVATHLARAGVRAGDPVALVSAGRAHDEGVGLAGVLSRGAIAVPFDAAAPPARIARIARARGARALVMDAGAAAIADAMGEHLEGAALPRVVLDAHGELAGETEARAPAGEPAACDGCFGAILHTSGSTGTPKPVPIAWSGLDAFTAWTSALVGLGPGDRVLRVAELVFDLAWFDHLATWRAGATLVTMSRRELAAGRALRDAIAALRPTVIYGVPSMFMKLVAALPPGEPLAPVPRAIFYAGEVFPPRELAAFAARVPGAELYNLYGPTETNVCTYHRVDRAALDGERETPIGLPCPYAACSLVAEDGSGRVVEGAGTGELVVSGPTTVGGGPYATRDRVERGEDGLFYFRGRIDRMIKVRGYRVEPGEVEAALGAHPAVRQAAVVPYDDPRLGRTLRAFVALRAGAAADERALRMFLAERLPPYMVPDKVTAVEELPVGTTGKIDYGALTGG
jgi:acyl-coenzyme A synthetase/AMP-(fatty) acid ligase